MPWAWAAAAAAVVSAGASIYSGQQQNKQAKYQAEVMRQSAERERQEAAAREDDFRRAQSRLMGSRRAAMGASGVEAGEGSPLLASEDMAGEVAYQALRIRSGGELTATRLEQQADLYRMAGSAAKTESYFRAGSSLLSGASYGYKGYKLSEGK